MMTVDDVKEMYDRDGKIETIRFYGGYASTRYDSSMLSNFYPCEFYVKIFEEEANLITCSEQLFMFFKAYHYKDEEIMKQILEAPYNPKHYKHLGYKVKGLDKDEWYEVSTKYMYRVIKLKFTQSYPKLKDYLLSTGDKILVEASMNNIWACGYTKNDDRCDNPYEWTGENRLGFLLMKLRDELRKEGN